MPKNHLITRFTGDFARELLRPIPGVTNQKRPPRPGQPEGIYLLPDGLPYAVDDGGIRQVAWLDAFAWLSERFEPDQPALADRLRFFAELVRREVPAILLATLD